MDNRVTVGSESALYEDFIAGRNATVVGNPPETFVSSASDAKSVTQLQERLQSDMLERGERVEHIEQSGTDHGDGSEVVFNIIAVALNVLKLPLVVSVYYGVGYGISSSMDSTEMGWVATLLSAVVTYLLGTWGIALFVAFLTRVGIASFRSGYTGYYTPRCK